MPVLYSMHALIAVAVTWLCAQVSQQDWRFDGSQLAAKSAKGPVQVDRSKSVFVKNVPFSAEDVDVAAFFSRAGEVVRQLIDSDALADVAESVITHCLLLSKFNTHHYERVC